MRAPNRFSQGTPGVIGGIPANRTQCVTTACNTVTTNGASPLNKDPGSGQITLGTTGSLTVQLTGARAGADFTLNAVAPNTPYQAQEAEVLGSSSNYELCSSTNQNSFITDKNCDVTFTVLVTSSGGDIFQVDPANNNSVGWIGGFSVPL